MNLNYPYDKASLMALALTADKKSELHTLVVDFDGEVILDPEVHFPDVAVTSYKFCTRLHDEYLRDDVQLISLYDSLDAFFKGGYVVHKYMPGNMDGKIAA